MMLRRGHGYFAHWCPACECLHHLPYPGGWTFNGNLESPTFSPSFKHGGLRMKMENGIWTGEYHRGPDGKALDGTCHYIITDGKIQFCPDSWHGRSDIVSMPPIPAHLRVDASETQD